MALLSGSIINHTKTHFVVYDNRAPVIEFNKLCHQVNERDNKDFAYYLSVDASTTCTGFCLAREDLKFHIVFDYERKSTEKTQFISDLEFIFSNLVKDLKIKILLVERPIQQAGGRARNVLTSLSSDIRKFIKNVPEFDDVRVEFVRPNSWKSAMIIKEKGTGRYNDKACMAEDIKDRYPRFTEHWRQVRSKDKDSFDAIGILYFYLEKLNDANGNAVNFSTIEFTHHTMVAAKYVSNIEAVLPKFPQDLYFYLEKLNDANGNAVNFSTIEFTHHTMVAAKYVSNIEAVLPKFPQDLLNKVGYEIVKWNPDYTYYENIKMASTRNKVVIIIHENDLKNQIRTCWETGLPYTNEKQLALFIFRHAAIKKADERLLEYYNYKTFMVY